MTRRPAHSFPMRIGVVCRITHDPLPPRDAKYQTNEDIEDDRFITVHPAPSSSHGRIAPPASLLPAGGAPTDTPTDTGEPEKD